MSGHELENRIRKNAKSRFPWAQREKTSAFRVYDLDMPEWPVAIDWYEGFAHVMEYPRRKQLRDGSLEGARSEVIRSTAAALDLAPEKIFTKTHERRAWGEAFEREAKGPSTLVTVQEHGLKFECNLSDYLDTGLFLDHRVTRARVGKEAKGKRVLNLFAYTGAFTVHAAAGGAKETTTVDLSSAYCSWAERNLELNGITAGAQHRVIRADVLSWLEAARGPYDLIVLDPPTFSSSKRMNRRFEVQRDHRWLVGETRKLLAPEGVLYFSTNFLGFELDASLTDGELLASRPVDFRRDVHRAWRFVGVGVGLAPRAPAQERAPAHVERHQKHRQHQQPPKRR